jgi:CheY-like chemotaxis protein
MLPMNKAAWRRSVRILLVEDSKPIRRENERALLEAGYQVACALDGETALRFAQEMQPELILLDMILPRMSGPEVLDHLKSNAATATIPVVVVSSLSEKNRDKLIEAGAVDYLEKSELRNEHGVNLLPQMLEKILARIRRERAARFSTVPARSRV